MVDTKTRALSETILTSFDDCSNKIGLYLAIKQLAKEMAEGERVKLPQASSLLENNETKKEEPTVDEQKDKDKDQAPSSNLNPKENIITKPEFNINKYIINYNNSAEVLRFQKIKSFYERSTEAQKLLMNQRELEKNKKTEKELKELKPSPGMNSNSERMVSKKHNKPLYLRTKEIMTNKNFKSHQCLLIQNENENEVRLLHKSKSYYYPYDKKKIELFVKDQLAWQHDKEEKVWQLRREIISKDQAKTIFSKSSNTQVHERLYHEYEENNKKRTILQMASIPTFRPEISKSTKQLLKKQNATGCQKKHFQIDSNPWNATKKVKKVPDWVKEIDKLKEWKRNDSPLSNLYKLNVRNNSATVIREDKIIAAKKFSSLFK